ncbi:hypothetical protein BGY98DRAFT_970680 [Russula aff. rugulosa BPL654]|nr:hypothetical protein BGY98DRAFT_970680 [Russula aff. rugulosa BPL654]
MERQLWRLLDLRDGGGLGFTIELSFLALRQLLPTSSSSDTSPSSELTKEFYTRTFEVIKSNWAKSKNSAVTQRILLDILCDLVIQRRGIFSDFTYPPYIMEMPLVLLRKMVDGQRGSHPHIDSVINELRDEDPGNFTETGIDLRDSVGRLLPILQSPAFVVLQRNQDACVDRASLSSMGGGTERSIDVIV